MADILGKALLDYVHGNFSEDLITETNISEPDEMPLPYLFRGYKDMPSIEQAALKHAKGSILDIGCGAGSHSLYLQKKGFDVTAIDISEGAIETCKLRGIEDAEVKNILDVTQTYDTLLLLMNGTGIFQRMELVSKYLAHLKTLLKSNGQILIDSSDLKYMYDSTDEGGILVPSDHYYGELEFTMTYKGETSPKFPWLYLDEGRFAQACEFNGFNFEILKRGEHFDYLARLTF